MWDPARPSGTSPEALAAVRESFARHALAQKAFNAEFDGHVATRPGEWVAYAGETFVGADPDLLRLHQLLKERGYDLRALYFNRADTSHFRHIL